MHTDGADASDSNLLDTSLSVSPSRVRRKAAQAACLLVTCFSLIVLSSVCWSALVKPGVALKIHPLSTGNLQTLNEKRHIKDATSDGSQGHDSTAGTELQPDGLDGNEENTGAFTWASHIFTAVQNQTAGMLSQRSQGHRLTNTTRLQPDELDGSENDTGTFTWASRIFTTVQDRTAGFFTTAQNQTGIVAWESQSCDSFENSKIFKAKEVFEHKTDLLGGEHHWAIVASNDRQFRLELYPISGDRSFVQISCMVLHVHHPESDQHPNHGWIKANRTLTLLDIRNQAEEYARQNPLYSVVAVPFVASANNCQTYVKDLMFFITGREFLTQTEETGQLMSITLPAFLIWTCCMVVWSLFFYGLWWHYHGHRVDLRLKDQASQVFVLFWGVGAILVTIVAGVIPYLTPIFSRLIGPAGVIILLVGCCLGACCGGGAITLSRFVSLNRFRPFMVRT